LADAATIASFATAGGTLALAVATFASIRSANRSARVAERSLLAAQRPILIPSHEDDPVEQVRFMDDKILRVEGHGAALKVSDGNLYMAIALRNGGAGIAVMHAWRVEPQAEGPPDRPDLDSFRRQGRDLFITANSTGFWQGAIRDTGDADYASLKEVIRAGGRVSIDLLYGDHEGGQRSIARFGTTARADGTSDGGRADVVRYWNVDGGDPR
jgi:hypothetical protein